MVPFHYFVPSQDPCHMCLYLQFFYAGAMEFLPKELMCVAF